MDANQITFFIIIVSFLFILTVEYISYEKKEKSKQKIKNEKEIFKNKIKNFTYNFLEPLVIDDDKYQLYIPISQDILNIYKKLLNEEFKDENILSSVPSEKYYYKWTELDSKKFLNELFFQILFDKFIEKFTKDKINSLNTWEQIREYYVQIFDMNTDYLMYIEHYCKINNINIPTSLEISVKEYLKELSLKNKVNEYKKLIKDNKKYNVKRATIDDIDRLDGFSFENFLCLLFNEMNYNVETTSDRGDQGADVIITQKGNKTVVQAKCYSDNVGNKAIQEVVAAIKFYKADNAMVVTNSFFTKSAKELADVNNVILWDRDKLSEMLSLYAVDIDKIYM